MKMAPLEIKIGNYTLKRDEYGRLTYTVPREKGYSGYCEFGLNSFEEALALRLIEVLAKK